MCAYWDIWDVLNNRYHADETSAHITWYDGVSARPFLSYWLVFHTQSQTQSPPEWMYLCFCVTWAQWSFHSASFIHCCTVVLAESLLPFIDKIIKTLCVAILQTDKQEKHASRWTATNCTVYGDGALFFHTCIIILYIFLRTNNISISEIVAWIPVNFLKWSS